MKNEVNEQSIREGLLFCQKTKWKTFDKIGDKIIGTYVAFFRIESPFEGKKIPIYQILSEDGKLHNLVSKISMSEELKKNNIQIGNVIEVKFSEIKIEKEYLPPRKILKVRRIKLK